MGKLDQRKIATCSYCGNRTLLNLAARDGHELACTACGAPLHEMKALKANRSKDAVKQKPRQAPHPVQQSDDMAALLAAGVGLLSGGGRHAARNAKHLKKKGNSLKKRAEKVFDPFEDLFDLFD